MAGMKRVLFYLPVVTPWWFDNKVSCMIRSLVAEAEVHVLVPPLWSNTGIGPEQLRNCASLTEVRWHIADGDGHPSWRTSPEDPDEIVEFVQAINPDYVLCRSADIATPSRFPGKMRYLMEPGAPPLFTYAPGITLQADFSLHGAMPDLSDDDREAIDTAFADIWHQMRARVDNHWEARRPRAEVLQNLGLPQDRKILAVPLEYEHEEAFNSIHHRFERNLDLIHHLAERLDDDFVLAITDHPLNYQHVDNSELYEAIAALGPRVHLVPNPDAEYFPTELLIRHCDGLIVQNTKAIYSGAYFGKPTLRLSKRPSAEWLRILDDLETLQAAAASGHQGPTEDELRLWFGFHMLHEIVSPIAITGRDILDRLDRPFSSDRLATGLERADAYQRQLDMAA